MPTPLAMLERPKPADREASLPAPVIAPTTKGTTAVPAPVHKLVASRSTASIPAPTPPGVTDAPDARISMLDKLSLAELPASTALEVERLTQIGMTTAELKVLENKYTTLQQGTPKYPAGEAKLVLEFFARLADPDLEEWLEEQRALGNFTGGRWPETEKFVGGAVPVYVRLAEKGSANGVATLNGEGELAQLSGAVTSGSALGATAVQPAQIALVSPLSYGAKFNGVRIEDAAIESGKTTLEAAQFSIFTVANTVAVAGAGPGGSTLLTTITGVAAGSVTLATPASTTVSGATTLYGTDDSAAWKALSESLVAGQGYRISCPAGRSLFNGISFGSTVSKSGVTLEFVGAGDRATYLQPISAAGAQTMMTAKGPGDSTASRCTFTSMTVGFDFADPIVNFAYTQPVVKLVNMQGHRVNCASRLLGTGVIWAGEGAYRGLFDGGQMQTGRYAIGVEITEDPSAPVQEDTLRFGETFVHEGCYGVVIRHIADGLDSIAFDQYKSAVYTPTKEEGKTLSGHQDREVFGEGHLAEEAKAGATTIKLEAGQAKAMGYEAGKLPSPVAIGYGELVEANKVLEVTGDVLTLAQPLRFTHAAAMVVMHGTFAVSLPGNCQSVTFGPACHLEGHSGAAILCDSPTLVTVQGGISSSRAVVRICGAATNIKVSRTLMEGAEAWLPGTVGPRNIGIEVPSWNTNSSLARLYVEDLEHASTEAIEYIYDPGANAAKVYTRVIDAPSGVLRTSYTVPKEDASSSSTLVHEQLSENGETRWQRLVNGAYILHADTKIQRRGTGSVIFEYWNGTEWEVAKSVAVGAGELRFGEDTVLLREAVAKLKTVGQIKAEDGLSTIYLEGAGLITITDGLFKHTPPNGTIAIHLDTTTGRKYVSFRANGLWQLVSYDYDAKGQNGIMTPQSAMGWRPGSLTATTGGAYVMRFKATTGFALTKATFRLVTAAGSNDKVEVAIYSAAWARLATSGEVASILNGSLGIATVPISYTLVPGTVYYAAMGFGTVGSSGAVVSGAEYGSGELAKYFGATAGTIEYDSHTSSVPLPEPFVGGGLPTTVPILALRQS
jgi:hypothetical protein